VLERKGYSACLILCMCVLLVTFNALFCIPPATPPHSTKTNPLPMHAG
jgi:hypothetical protein